MDDNGREGRRERQERLKQRFFDLANAFVNVRMKFLRFTGVQPPERRDPPEMETKGRS